MVLLVMGCGVLPDYEVAEEQNYYFIIHDLSRSADSRADIGEIKQMLAAKKYIITHRSGRQWPFFQSYDLNYPVPRDSIMAPHVYVHRMMPYHPDDNDQKGILVRVDYSIDEKGQPVVGVVLSRRKNGVWQQLVDTGDHTILQKYYANDEEKNLRTFQTIVRYTFK